MKKRMLPLLLVFLMVFQLLPAAALASPGGILMEYDDYLDISGVVTVPDGDERVAYEGGKLHAIGVGATTITVDGVETAVNVAKARLNVVLIAGQSNANGTAGTLNGVYPASPDAGCGYYWSGGTLKDLKAYADKFAADNASANGGAGMSVGFHPALAARWYQLTGEKTVIIHSAHSGQPISFWASADAVTAEAEGDAAMVSACIAAIGGNPNFEIARTGYYWLQGESNASVNTYGFSTLKYATTPEYRAVFERLHALYVGALTVAGAASPVCGIMSVRTRANLLTWAANEYCGVRAAQQDIANRNEDVFMASTITEEWLSSVNDADKFSTSGGAIHYSQKGYNLLGADAADNMYAALASSPAADFSLYGHDGVTVYGEGSLINADDNLRPIGDDNVRESGAAQIAVRTLPISAKSSSVTMTLKNSDGEDVTGIIDDSGYIADASLITQRLTLTVSANGVSKVYTLTSDDAEATETGYYWDFTDTAAANGAVVSAVTKPGVWAENDITYYNPDGASTHDVSLTASGINNAANGRGYFSMDTPVTLKKDEAWTIEWKGNVGASSSVLAYNSSASKTVGESLIYLAAGGSQGVDIRNTTSPVGSERFTLADSSGAVASSVINDSNAVWYIVNDGTGRVTLYTSSGGNVVKYKTALVKGDFTFNGIMGYFIMGDNVYNYYGSMKYLKIYRDAAIVEKLAVTLASPDGGDSPQTAVSGVGYTGSVQWSPVVDGRFAGDTVYTAAVSLTALDGYKFADCGSAAVAGALITDVAVSADGKSLTFMAQFPQTEPYVDTGNYYWTFANGVVSVEDDYWTAKDLTAKTMGSVNYYEMESPVTLPADAPWTIEWQGSSLASSVVLANNDEAADINTSKAGEYIYIANNGGATDKTCVYLATHGGAAGNSVATMTDVKDSVKRDTSAVWYIIHDGSGNITMATLSGGELTVQRKASVALPEDGFTYNGIKGYFSTNMPIGYSGALKYMKIYSEAVTLPEATIGTTVYGTLAAAVAAAETASYPSTPETATEIKLLRDVESGFDVGVETGSLSTFKTQNIVLDLAGHTLTLGHPPVGSSSDPALRSNGLRVLAYSKLHVKNGVIVLTNSQLTSGVTNYGTLSLDGVETVIDGSAANLEYTVENRGALTLCGAARIIDSPDGIAICNQPYNYSDGGSVNVNAVLNVADANVEVGNMLIKLADVIQGQNGTVNNGVPEINISAGTFGSITDDGETAKTPVGNITGGTFSAEVPEELCAAGFIPKANGDGSYGVKAGVYRVEMTVDGAVSKFETINEAVANAPRDSYAAGKAGGSAKLAEIRLLADVSGGFDVGVETGSLSTFKIQNIVLDLDGHTLTLGDPLVGSAGTVTNGIRVLAYSKLTLKNGTVSGLESDALRGLQNYGAASLYDVVFESMGETLDSIGNFGSLTLSGSTVIPNGTSSAVLNSTYLYSDDSQVPVTLSITEDTVTTGRIAIDLAEYTHPQTGSVNVTEPQITISAGTIESISATGDDKDIVGGVSGGTFSAAVPEDLCADGFIPAQLGDGAYGVEIDYAAEMGGIKYATLASAVAAAETAPYPSTPETATEIRLLRDVESGFDVGVETGSLSTFKTQNIVLDLDGHTLTLGYPPVGSSSLLKTNGLRVLAFSKLVIKNGDIDIDNDSIKIGLANYGVLELDSVEVSSDDGVLYTVNNRGALTLEGTTSVENGMAAPRIAITNQPYNYPDSRDINASLTVSSADVVVGDILVELADVTQGQTGAVNSGVPEINISAGTFGSITDDGETAKTPVGNITGGTFSAEVPEELCAEGFMPEQNGNGTYGVSEIVVITETADGVRIKLNEGFTGSAMWTEYSESGQLLGVHTITESSTELSKTALNTDAVEVSLFLLDGSSAPVIGERSLTLALAD